MTGKQQTVHRAGPARHSYRRQFGVIVICRDEAHQARLYRRFHAKGLEVKVVTT